MKGRWLTLTVAVLMAAVVGTGQVTLPYFEDFEDPVPPALPATGEAGVPPAVVAAAWAVAQVRNPVVPVALVFLQGLWGTVDRGDFYAEPESVSAFPSGAQALYYGNVVNGRGTYDTGAATIGAVRTPELAATRNTAYQVRFWMYRVVESFAGQFDRTRVFVVFMNGGTFLDATTGLAVANEHDARLQIFARDSSHPSSTTWEQMFSDVFTAPNVPLDRMRIIFEFESRDNRHNDFLGWLIDDVWVGTPLAITTATLPQGTERVRYGTVANPDPNIVLHFPLAVTGGTERYTWSLGRRAPGLPPLPLPPGLVLDPAQGWIYGIPTTAGTWPVIIEVTDDLTGAVARREFDLTILPAAGAGLVRYAQNWTAPGLGGWTVTGPTNLWARRDNVWQPGGGGPDIIALPAAVGVMYYGAIASPPAAAAGDTYTYNTGARTQGVMTSPAITLNAADAGRHVGIEFLHWRRVEEYNGAFDQTFVEIRFDTGPWIRVWYKDSRNPSEAAWQRVFVVSEVTIPTGTRNLFVRFGFDSVDGTGNGFTGWIIDDVAISVVQSSLEITTESPLPDGYNGVAYSHTLRAQGGTLPYTWEIQDAPAWLALNPVTGVISGTAVTGQYTITVKVTDATLRSVEKLLRLVVQQAQALFTEDFNGFTLDANRWLNPTGGTNLWHLTDTVIYGGADLLPTTAAAGIPVTENAAYFGRRDESRWHYDVGVAKGELVSRPFPLSGAKYIGISFWYWREVESYNGAFDQTYMEVKFGSGPWLKVWYKDSRNTSEKAWTRFESPGITVPAGVTTMQIRFVFDSGDRHNNGFIGWIVDNIRVTKAASGSPLSALAVPEAEPRGAPRISVFNYPNPIRDVHTTTFAVRGVEAEALRVEVYDLSGRLVYKAEASGSELVWHTDDQYGRYLANGVYLYRAYVKVGGTWIASEIQKLAIFR